MDRLARARWLSHRPERLDGQLRRAAPCRPEGWYLYHGGDGQFPGQSADEQIAAHALVAARGQSPPPSSLRRLQWYAWFWLRTEILPSQRYETASGDCRLNPPNLRRSLLMGPKARFLMAFPPLSKSLPPCSRPSRTSPSGGRQAAPILDRHSTRRRSRAAVGTEKWLAAIEQKNSLIGNSHANFSCSS